MPFNFSGLAKVRELRWDGRQEPGCARTAACHPALVTRRVPGRHRVVPVVVGTFIS